MFGVSSAFVVSQYGPGFTPEHYCQALSLLRELGFTGFQPAIYTKQGLPDWRKGGAQKVRARSRELGVQATQVMGHFLMEEFGAPERLQAGAGQEDLKGALEAAKVFEECKVFTVPLGPFKVNYEEAGRLDGRWFGDLQQRLAEKLGRFVEAVSGAGLQMAVEILPFSLIGGFAGFQEVSRQIGSGKLGVNLDTGHAWANREVLALAPLRLAGRVFGVHLKDNNSNENQALAPGKGTIEWSAFLRNLLASGYQGSLDVEIGCKAEQVREEYQAGLDYLKPLVSKIR